MLLLLAQENAFVQPQMAHSSVQATITSRTEQMVSQHLFHHSFEARSLRSRCPQGYFPWGLSPWFTDGCLLPVSSHGCPSVHVCILISFSCEDASHIGFGSNRMTSCYLNDLFQNALSKYSDILKSWSLGLSTCELGEYSAHPITDDICHSRESNP